ncbi:MAG: hypothetical protein IPL88_12475 [Rhizobiales bacterium]|nr:hypothetical protein [Hyphomicrobiales bacterium]
MRLPIVAASLFMLGAGAAVAQWGPPPPSHGGWGPPPYGYRRPPPPPPGWGPPPPRRFAPAPAPVRCWWRETPWGPRRVCRRAYY